MVTSAGGGGVVTSAGGGGVVTSAGGRGVVTSAGGGGVVTSVGGRGRGSGDVCGGRGVLISDLSLCLRGDEFAVLRSMAVSSACSLTERKSDIGHSIQCSSKHIL